MGIILCVIIQSYSMVFVLLKVLPMLGNTISIENFKTVHISCLIHIISVSKLFINI